MTKLELMQKLKDARDAKNVSLQDASRVLSIRAQVLQDLEEGNYQKLGALLYVKSYIRKYAAYLKIDVDEIEYLLSQLEDPFTEEVTESPIRAQLNEEKRMVHRSFFRWYLLIIGVLSLVGVMAYFIYGEKVTDIFPIKLTPERMINTYQEETVNASNLLKNLAVVDIAEDSEPRDSDTNDLVEEVVAVDTKAALSEFELNQILNSGSDIAVEGGEDPLLSDMEMAKLPEGVSTLLITLGAGESWFQIKDKHNKVMMNEILPGNATYHFDGEAPFSLHIGNARSIDKIVFNGKEVEEKTYRPTARTTVSKVTLKPEEES